MSRVTAEKKYWISLGIFAVLGMLAWFTLEEERFRLGTMLIVAFFALRVVLLQRYGPRERSGDSE